MHQILNTLYVMTQKAYLHLDHETLKVKIESETKLQVPLLHLGAIFCFGNVSVSPFLLHRCADDGRSLVFLEESGRFKARLAGPVTGNVLLRSAQHVASSVAGRPLAISRHIVAGKLQNARQILLRGAREDANAEDAAKLQGAAEHLAGLLPRIAAMDNLDQLRGLEGDGARAYFDVFDLMIKEDRERFAMSGRNRRPPRDRINALLSFLYTMLLNDCVSAAEGVGLDPQVGFLHVLRPGRPALGLDLMEELRCVVADRLALTLVNRRQVGADDFDDRAGGSVYLNDTGRKAVVAAYQKRSRMKFSIRFWGKRSRSACCRTFRPGCWPGTCATIWRVTHRFCTGKGRGPWNCSCRTTFRRRNRKDGDDCERWRSSVSISVSGCKNRCSSARFPRWITRN
ncbi:MAG TPA: type I-C CRISPR-associated endonuclease Cas1c [Planctomycetaceae bacterium]